MDQHLVADRSCGSCTVCCTALTVDEADLQKLPGHTCPKCAVGQGCTIYETRPGVCRGWFCAWRQHDWIGIGLRPDRSDILIHRTREDIPAGYAGDAGLNFAILARTGLAAEGLAEALAHAIRANIACFLCVPGAPGFPGIRWLVNDDLSSLCGPGQKSSLLRDLRKLYSSALMMLGTNVSDVIAFSHPKPAD